VSRSRKIPEHLVDFIESGVSLLVGTRDARLRPEMTRACGARVSEDRTRLTIFLPHVAGARALANLADNGRIAVGVQRPYDNNCYQLKGTKVDLHVATESERVVVERYVASFVEAMYTVGLPRAIIGRFDAWPASAVTFAVEDIFIQSPGPNAGRRMEEEAT
jgi:hypothetical protein